MDGEEKTRSQEEESELLGKLQDEIRRMTVSDHLAYMMESLAALAARKMGATPETRGESDLEQARLAIDAFRALVQVVGPVRSQSDMAIHRGMLSQLQLAYVGLLNEDSGEPADSEGATSKLDSDSAPEVKPESVPVPDSESKLDPAAKADPEVAPEAESRSDSGSEP